MKTKLQITTDDLRPTKDEIIRTRCSTAFKRRLARMAVFLDKDLSDIMREALIDKLQQFEQRTQMVA